jgi:hypothetical protein
MRAEGQAFDADSEDDDTANIDASEDSSDSQELAAGTQQYVEGQYRCGHHQAVQASEEAQTQQEARVRLGARQIQQGLRLRQR